MATLTLLSKETEEVLEVIDLEDELMAALTAQAQAKGMPVEDYILKILREAPLP